MSQVNKSGLGAADARARLVDAAAEQVIAELDTAAAAPESLERLTALCEAEPGTWTLTGRFVGDLGTTRETILASVRANPGNDEVAGVHVFVKAIPAFAPAVEEPPNAG